MSEHFVIVPGYAEQWLTPQSEHTDEQPWCDAPDCLCHFDGDHMERHFVRPVALGQMTIGEALARYGSHVSREAVTQ